VVTYFKIYTKSINILYVHLDNLRTSVKNIYFCLMDVKYVLQKVLFLALHFFRFCKA
jgi:hypothetical protein